MTDLADLVRSTNAWACNDCGKCTASCPLSRAGADYSPRRHVLSSNLGEREALLDDADLFACLTCSQCDQRCPVEVDYTGLILELRALAKSDDKKPECPHGGALQSVMRMMANGGAQQNRLEWLDGDLETEPTTGKIFYWTGCTMYYDAFFPELGVSTLDGTRDAVRLFNKLGERPVVSADERCCGHDLLWNGDRESFESLAKRNAALIEASGAEALVTSCAECLRTLKVDYRPYFKDSPPQMMHITEYLGERMEEFDLGGEMSRRVTFQDPCRLGRHLGIYDPPRTVLEAIPGLEFVEMDRTRSSALCCAGGTWSNCDRFDKQIQVERLKQAKTTGAEVLVTGCPKCQVHFRCAMKDPSLGEEISIELRDVAEIVAAALSPPSEKA